MSAGARVFARVLIGRAVATKRCPAFLTGAQMDPVRTNLDALFALPAFWEA